MGTAARPEVAPYRRRKLRVLRELRVRFLPRRVQRGALRVGEPLALFVAQERHGAENAVARRVSESVEERRKDVVADAVALDVIGVVGRVVEPCDALCAQPVSYVGSRAVEEGADNARASVRRGRLGGRHAAETSRAGAACESEEKRLDLVVGIVAKGEEVGAGFGGGGVQRGVAETTRGHFERHAGSGHFGADIDDAVGERGAETFCEGAHELRVVGRFRLGERVVYVDECEADAEGRPQAMEGDGGGGRVGAAGDGDGDAPCAAGEPGAG